MKHTNAWLTNVLAGIFFISLLSVAYTVGAAEDPNQVFLDAIEKKLIAHSRNFTHLYSQIDPGEANSRAANELYWISNETADIVAHISDLYSLHRLMVNETYMAKVRTLLKLTIKRALERIQTDIRAINRQLSYAKDNMALLSEGVDLREDIRSLEERLQVLTQPTRMAATVR